jgi:hypothetical protein
LRSDSVFIPNPNKKTAHYINNGLFKATKKRDLAESELNPINISKSTNAGAFTQKTPKTSLAHYRRESINFN